MPLSESEIVRIQREQANTIRYLHQRHENEDGVGVCGFCLTPYPCRETEWALEVLNEPRYGA